MIITKNCIQKNLNFKINSIILNRIENLKLNYEILNNKEFESYILDFIKTLDSNLKAAGEHRKNDWESGWAENFKDFQKTLNLNALTPKYHTKQTISRFNRNIISHSGGDFDLKLHELFVDSVLMEYLSEYQNIFEFGCGTGYHVFRLNEMLPNKNWTALDWSKSSQKLINLVCEKMSLSNIFSENFDYFNPNYNINISESALYTIASLEQIGRNFIPFIEYIQSKKPNICIHFEPISEVLDENNLVDNLTIKYFKKRNYLDGFLTYLNNLEKIGKAKIIDVRRLNYGSQYVEGHTLIIWKPI